MEFRRVLFRSPAGCRQQAPAPVEPPPKTVVASGSEDAGAVSSDAKPAVPTQAEVLKGTDWPALRLVSGDAWIDCDVAGAPLPGTVAIVPEPADRKSTRLNYRHSCAARMPASA